LWSNFIFVTIREKVKAVEAVFNELERASQSFQRESGLRCISGCGKCCFKSDIEATVLEFIPFAFHVFKEGKAMELLEQLKQPQGPFCTFLKAFTEEGGKGMCTEYQYRGMICRLFGFSARIDKYSQKQLVTCQIIKSEQAEHYQQATEKIKQGLPVPVMSQYYTKIQSIDPQLGSDFYPINTAIRKAIETVLHYYAYRTRRSA
jgi:uncharacterized protein